MKKLKYLFLLIILFVIGCSSEANYNLKLNPGIGADEYYRLDLKNLDKEASLGNLRIITKGQYELGQAKEKYHLDENYDVDETGLDDLNISGSRQFSKEQFFELADKIKQLNDDRVVYVIDLRQENHAFVNGYPVSYFKQHNWANKDLSDEEISNNQDIYFSKLFDKEMSIYLKGDNEEASSDFLTFKVDSCINEKELVETVGFGYFNIPCTDHIWPSAENIDKFIEFVKTIDMNNTWLHFHCVAGEGRTGTFMCLYDMMKNPEIAMKDIAYRQAMLGSNYPLYIQTEDDWKKELYQEKADNFVLLYRYVQENYKSNYETSWSEWLSNKSNSVSSLTVSLLPQLSNGEYARQLLIEMWEQIEPNIKLEFVETSYSGTDYPENVDVLVKSMENMPYRVLNNHYRQLYTDEIACYDDLVSFAKNNLLIDDKIYGIPQLLCDNLLFYYKDDIEMSKVANVYELADLLNSKRIVPIEVITNIDKIYYNNDLYSYYALDSSIDEKGTYEHFSSNNYLNKYKDISNNLRQIIDNGIYSTGNLKNIEEFSKGSGRGIICFSDDLYYSNLDLYKLAVKKISFANGDDIPLMYMDVVCISEHVKDDVKFAKCLKLANLLSSKEYISRLITMDDKVQYFIPVLESVFEYCEKYPLYKDFYKIINDPNLKLAICDKEDYNDIKKKIVN